MSGRYGDGRSGLFLFAWDGIGRREVSSGCNRSFIGVTGSGDVILLDGSPCAMSSAPRRADTCAVLRAFDAGLTRETWIAPLGLSYASAFAVRADGTIAVAGGVRSRTRSKTQRKRTSSHELDVDHTSRRLAGWHTVIATRLGSGSPWFFDAGSADGQPELYAPPRLAISCRGDVIIVGKWGYGIQKMSRVALLLDLAHGTLLARSSAPIETLHGPGAVLPTSDGALVMTEPSGSGCASQSNWRTR